MRNRIVFSHNFTDYLQRYTNSSMERLAEMLDALFCSPPPEFRENSRSRGPRSLRYRAGNPIPPRGYTGRAWAVPGRGGAGVPGRAFGRGAGWVCRAGAVPGRGRVLVPGFRRGRGGPPGRAGGGPGRAAGLSGPKRGPHGPWAARAGWRLGGGRRGPWGKTGGYSGGPGCQGPGAGWGGGCARAGRARAGRRLIQQKNWRRV